MTDLSWVEEVYTTTSPGEVNSRIDHDDWKLLHVTGGLHSAIEYVLGRATRKCNPDCIHEGERHDQCEEAHGYKDCGFGDGTPGEIGCGRDGHEWR